MQSPHAPSLPGILELTGQVVRPADLTKAAAAAFALETGAEMLQASFSRDELEASEYLANSKYHSPAWNLKR